MNEEEYHALERQWNAYVSTLGGRGWSLTYSDLTPWQRVYVVERDRRKERIHAPTAECLTDESSLVGLLRTII